jgi:glutaminase
LTVQASESIPAHPAWPADVARRAPGAGALGDPPATPLRSVLRRAFERHRRADDGTVASYIPELGRADPTWFGIAAMTLEGVLHEVGDSRQPFTIQSISKPLTYGLVLDDLGEDAVRARIGVEPTGEAFNAITLAPGTGRPLNPMVNAGAIAAAGLVRGDVATPDPLARLIATYGRAAGRGLVLDREVLDSERATGHRNRAIAHLLRASGALEEDADAAVERYFSQCSVAVTAADLAAIAATLANGGVQPATRDRILSAATTQAVLAVMATCGMYDGAGEWLYTVGLPAKSGVAGGLLVVVPGQLGLAVFSPPLDASGNSVRGVRVCRDLVRDLGLHPLRTEGPRPSTVRATYRLSEVGSKRQRLPAQRSALASLGDRCLVIEVGGVVSYLAPDELAERVAAAGDAGPRAVGGLEALIVDLHRVERIDPPALDLLAGLIVGWGDAGLAVVVAGRGRLGPVIGRLDDAVARAGGGPLQAADDLDAALEAVEDALLAEADQDSGVDPVPLAGHDLVAGLADTDLAIVGRHLERRSYMLGERIIERGAVADALLLLESGRASVTVDVAGQGPRRLSTLGPGMCFGEAALVTGERRTADVRADGEVVCLALTTDGFAALLDEHPEVAARLLRNLLRTVTATAARLTREVAVLAG